MTVLTLVASEADRSAVTGRRSAYGAKTLAVRSYLVSLRWLRARPRWLLSGGPLVVSAANAVSAACWCQGQAHAECDHHGSAANVHPPVSVR